MKFLGKAFCLLALSFGVQASPIVARQSGNAVLADLTQTGNDLIALNNTLNSFSPGKLLDTLVALKIQIQATKIAKDLKQSVKDANAINGILSSDDTLAIATAVANLEPQIQSVLNNIIVHKPSFKTGFLFIGDLSKTVESDLVQERDLIGQFGAALAQHAAPPYDTVAPLLTKEVQALFDAGIAAYAKCTGLICLPSLNFRH